MERGFAGHESLRARTRAVTIAFANVADATGRDDRATDRYPTPAPGRITPMTHAIAGSKNSAGGCARKVGKYLLVRWTRVESGCASVLHWGYAGIGSRAVIKDRSNLSTGSRRAACHDGPVSIVGKPVIIDELDPKLGGKIVKFIIDDNERARRERAKKRKKRKKKR
jgi:hypothetical protein